jgi:8-amino-7-oxononanoate synthase
MQLLQQRIHAMHSQGLTRRLVQPNGIDVSSNDYLGFAQDTTLRERYIARLQQAPVGAAAARLLRGNLALYEETEQLLAEFVGRETALLFSSGYSANVGLLSALLHTGDVVFSDANNHASIIDGIRLSRAQKIIFPHRDYVTLEQQLQQHQKHAGLKIIVTESVFSMNGNKADLSYLAELAQRFNALFIVDEAHSTGLWGSSLVATLGLTEQVFATVHCGGKALGASGAWIAGNQLLRDYLLHFARSFIFSTAPLPALPLLLQEACKFHNAVGHERAEIVKQRARQFRHWLSLDAGDSPIIAIIMGDSQRALQISEQLQHKSWDVRAVRPPTVSAAAAGLRITVKWCNSDEELLRLARDLNGL